MVVLISVYLLTGHWLFHGRAPASVTEVSLLTWNTLPSILRRMTSYGQFRRHLKAHLSYVLAYFSAAASRIWMCLTPVAAASVWNMLPPAITSLPSLQTLKCAVKTELFR